LRRSVNRIPTMAIDELKISKNDSALYDETVAHRFGLVPLKMEKSVKEGDVRKLKLSVKKPGFVYSGDIKGDAEIVFDKIPLTLLDENQEMKLELTTKVGTGEEHAKYTPGLIFYRNSTEITMNKTHLDAVKKAFPDNEVKVKSDKIVVLDNKPKAALDFCEGLCERIKEKAEVKETGEIIFSVESFGQLNPKEILEKAMDILEKDLKAFGKALK